MSTDLLAPIVRRIVSAAPADSVNLRELVIGWTARPLVVRILEICQWNQSEAAQVLGINRNTLRTLIRKHRIAVEPVLRPVGPFGRRPTWEVRA